MQERPPVAKSAGVRLGVLPGTQVLTTYRKPEGPPLTPDPQAAPSLGSGKADPGRTRQPGQVRARRQTAAGRTSSGRQWHGKVHKIRSMGTGAGEPQQPRWERRTSTLLGMPAGGTGRSSYPWGPRVAGGAEGAAGGLAPLTVRQALCPPGPPGDSATFQGSWGLRWASRAMEAGCSVLRGHMEHGPLRAARGGLGTGGRLPLLKSFWNHI